MILPAVDLKLINPFLPEPTYRPGAKPLHEIYSHIKNLNDVYETFWRPFGSLLSDLEHEGFLVDLEHLREAEKQAKSDQIAAEK